jgi:hypothetical protein
MKKIFVYMLTMLFIASSMFIPVSNAATVPTVTTDDATGVEETNATLRGTLTDDGGETCNTWFEYGLTTGYGNKTTNQTKNTGESFMNQVVRTGSFSYFDVDSSNLIATSSSSSEVEDMLDGNDAPGNDVWYDPSFNGEEYFILDLGGYYCVGGFRGRSYRGSDPTNIDIYVSYTNGNWGSAVISDIATWQDTDSWQTVDSTDKVGRYVKVIVDETELGEGVWFQWGSSGATGNKGFDINVSNCLAQGTLYHYYAVANNSNTTTYGSDQTFLTKPQIPTGLSTNGVNSTKLNVSWTKGDGANNTYVERHTSSSFARGDGTLLYNGTGTYVVDTGLIPDTTYYYQLWSFTNWDALYQWSDDNTSIDNATTNSIPTLTNGAVTPSTGSESSTSYLFNVTYIDLDGDLGADLRVNISLGSTYFNETMTWESGDNITGANYIYSKSFYMVGTYTYYFYGNDSYDGNISSSYTFDVGSNTSFSLNFPIYLNVGENIQADGSIANSTGDPITDIWAYTTIKNSTGIVVSGSDMKYYVVSGRYEYTFSTSSMTPGIYNISVNYSYAGDEIYTNRTFYLSTAGGPGHYATPIYFNFYDTKGIGLLPNLFKIYVSDDTTIDLSERIYSNTYNTYTQNTIYYRIDDYFDNQIYPTSGSYKSHLVTLINEGIDIPITWYDLSIKNLNESIMTFTMENDSAWYNITLFPMDSAHINVLTGNYNITLYFYSAYNGSLLSTVTDTITITGDAFYIATGYNAMVHISWYNTNEALGLPDETLKLYIDGDRQTSTTYWTYINNTVNITIKDYYNLTLYTGTHTLTSQYTFLDFGLTFHSWLFGNKNDKYYMISLLRENGSRWFERGIVPYGEREFILP